MNSARHSQDTTRWGTPPEWIEMARKALGGRIDLDPMSELAFNAAVRAERFWSAADDAFARPHWKCSTMLLNPDGRFTVQAWRRLTAEFTAGNVGAAIWIGFSVEQLCILADEGCHPADFSMLFCRRRISFVRHDGKQGSPSHGNYVCALGVDPDVFEWAFADRGRFHHGQFSTAITESESFGGAE